MPSYYCHQCQEIKGEGEVQYENEGILCSTCHSDFLEEMTNSNRHEFGHSLISLLGPFGRSHEISGSAASGAADNSGAESQAAARGRRRDSPNHPHQPSLPMMVHFGGELDQMVLPLFHMFGIRHLPMMEEAYSLDDIVTQLLNQLDSGGPPPATSDELKRIGRVPITRGQVDQGLQCFVCFDEFQLDERVDRLPCQHHFHRDCIMPWLEKHGTCPVCRKTLAGEDTTTQTFAEAGSQDDAARLLSGRRHSSDGRHGGGGAGGGRGGEGRRGGGGAAGSSSSNNNSSSTQQPYVEEEFD